MQELIERIESAKAGSRELDDEIATLLFTEKTRTCIKGLTDEAGGMWMFRYPNGSIGSSLRFTTSIDAAMTLVPRGWIVSIVRGFNNDGEYRTVVKLTDSFSVDRGCDPCEEKSVTVQMTERLQCQDPTPLALVAACLRAQIKDTEQ